MIRREWSSGTNGKERVTAEHEILTNREDRDITISMDIDLLTPVNNPNLNQIPLERLIELRAKRLSYNEIAKIVGCTKQNVWLRIQGYAKDCEDVEEFKANRADLMASIQHRILSSIDNDEIKKAPLATKLMSYGILYDKERLERGQSTQNISVADEYIRRRDTRKCNDNIELPSDSTK